MKYLYLHGLVWLTLISDLLHLYKFPSTALSSIAVATEFFFAFLIIFNPVSFQLNFSIKIIGFSILYLIQ